MISRTNGSVTTKYQLDTIAEAMSQLINLPIDRQLMGNNFNNQLIVYVTLKQEWQTFTGSSFSSDRIYCFIQFQTEYLWVFGPLVARNTFEDIIILFEWKLRWYFHYRQDH